MSDQVHEAHLKYHYSLRYKLRSAVYHVERLGTYLNSQQAQAQPPEAIVYRVNFHFDGFTHVIGSALDIFAREIIAYFGQPMPQHVYFQTAHQTVSSSHPGNAILPKLDDPTWRSEFSEYRNTATHESVVGSNYMNEITVEGGLTHIKIRFPLPDDPRAALANRTYKNNPDIVEYCRRTLVRTLRLLNPAYVEVRDQARAKGAFPL